MFNNNHKILFLLSLILTCSLVSCGKSDAEKVDELLEDLSWPRQSYGYEMIGGGDEKKEDKAIKKLIKMGSRAAPHLIAKLEDANFEGRAYITALLNDFEPEPEIIEAFIKAMNQSDDTMLAESAAFNLAYFYPHPDVLPALLQGLSGNYWCHGGSLNGLLFIELRQEDVPILIKYLALGNHSEWIVKALGKAGPEAAEALPVLYGILDSTEDEELRETLEKAISKIESK